MATGRLALIRPELAGCVARALTVDLSAGLAEEEVAREELLTLQTEIEKAEQQVAQIPQFLRQLETTRKALAAMQKPEAATSL